MAWAYIASTAVSATAGLDQTQSPATALGAAVALNDRIVVKAHAVRGDSNNPTTPGVTDSLGNTYVKDSDSGSVASGAFRTVLYTFSAKVTSAGTPTITFKHSGGGTVTGGEADFEAAGYSGTDTGATPVDVSAVTSGTSTTPSSGATAATGAANELVSSGLDGNDAAAATITAGSGYTARITSHTGTKVDMGLEDKDSGSSGATPSGTWTVSTSELWIADCVVYKIVGAGAVDPFPVGYGRWPQRRPPNMRTLLAR